jgi:hypothetical protein
MSQAEAELIRAYSYIGLHHRGAEDYVEFIFLQFLVKHTYRTATFGLFYHCVKRLVDRYCINLFHVAP